MAVVGHYVPVMELIPGSAPGEGSEAELSLLGHPDGKNLTRPTLYIQPVVATEPAAVNDDPTPTTDASAPTASSSTVASTVASVSSTTAASLPLSVVVTASSSPTKPPSSTVAATTSTTRASGEFLGGVDEAPVVDSQVTLSISQGVPVKVVVTVDDHDLVAWAASAPGPADAVAAVLAAHRAARVEAAFRAAGLPVSEVGLRGVASFSVTLLTKSELAWLLRAPYVALVKLDGVVPPPATTTSTTASTSSSSSPTSVNAATVG